MRTLSQLRFGRPSPRKRNCGLQKLGFTLIELMIVISIILVLIGMAAVEYGRFVQRSREAVLMYNLRTMREMIERYTSEKEAAPQSLEDLCHAGYMREVPLDPMTHAREWEQKYDTVFVVSDQGSTGLVDVSSKSTGTALDGTKYSEW